MRHAHYHKLPEYNARTYSAKPFAAVMQRRVLCCRHGAYAHQANAFCSVGFKYPAVSDGQDKNEF